MTNLQGDGTKLVKSDGTVAANYEYDAWGKLLSVKDKNGNAIGSSLHIGLMNPLRYRGYVYDDEIGLYYLQSRYYDPTTGRFVNADRYCSTSEEPVSTNMFVYCLNSPIIRIDTLGTWSKVVYTLKSRTYQKHSALLVGDNDEIPLTEYIGVREGSSISWKSSKQFNVSVSVNGSYSGKALAISLGVQFSYTVCRDIYNIHL